VDGPVHDGCSCLFSAAALLVRIWVAELWNVILVLPAQCLGQPRQVAKQRRRAPNLEKLYIPSPEKIAAAIREVHGYSR